MNPTHLTKAWHFGLSRADLIAEVERLKDENAALKEQLATRTSERDTMADLNDAYSSKLAAAEAQLAAVRHDCEDCIAAGESGPGSPMICGAVETCRKILALIDATPEVLAVVERWIPKDGDPVEHVEFGGMSHESFERQGDGEWRDHYHCVRITVQKRSDP